MIPSIYQLKPRFQQCLSPLTGALHHCGISANTVTVAATFACIIYADWMLTGSRLAYLFLPLFMLLRMAFNAIDGMLARRYCEQSSLGALLNETGDLVCDAALFLPFALLPGVRMDLALGVTFLMLLSEFVGVLALTMGSKRRYDGPFGKSDRAFVFGALGFMIGLGVPLAANLNLILTLMVLLLIWTVANRARHALKNAD